MSSASAFVLQVVEVSPHVAVSVIVVVISSLVALCSSMISVGCLLTPSCSIAFQFLYQICLQVEGKRAFFCHQFVKSRDGSLPVFSRHFHHRNKIASLGLYSLGKIIFDEDVVIGTGQVLGSLRTFSEY